MKTPTSLPTAVLRALLVAGSAIMLATASKGQSDPYGFEVVYTFGGNSAYNAENPMASLIQGSDGRFYGTTSGGAANTAGTVFRIDADGGNFTELYAFNYPVDGGSPESCLVQGMDGRLYGTTDGGGTTGAGTIFSVGTDGSSFTVLHTFALATDGGYPQAGLVQGPDGTLYGTAVGGGINSCGSVFSIKPDGSQYTVLHLFTGATDGATPLGGLVFGADGRLYGTTLNGSPGGTIYSVATNGGGFAVLHTFSYQVDGNAPYGPLIQGRDGRLYGLASNGGANFADTFSGTLFAVATDGSGYTVLRSFSAATDGAYPLAGLVQASDGNLYGTTNQGGANGNGTIFSVGTDGSGFTVLRSLALTPDGANSTANLIQASDGNLYGTTEDGGVFYSGTIFGIAPVGGGPNPVPAPPIPSAPEPVAPTFLFQPTATSADTGAAAALWAVASGLPPPSYQWNFEGVPIAYANSPVLEIPSVQAADAGEYTVTVTNSAGTVTSSAALLTVNASGSGVTLSYVQQPASQTIAGGSTVAFTAQAATVSSGQSSGGPSHGRAADASSPPSYQWFCSGSPIPGATDQTYVLQNATWENAGLYTCIATNASGSLQSNPASLDVVTGTGDPGRLINLSCRADSESGGSQLIAGYVIGGAGTSGNETVLIRATGPTLSSFGVSGTLPDPELTLDQSVAGANTLVASNSGWKGAALVASTAAEVGAFSWNPASADAALVESLPVGAYTAQVTGVDSDSGVALAEVYDATPSGTYTAASPRLINLSARVLVGTSSNVLIAGFVVGGTTAKTLLIRASGPALKAFSLSGTLPDPQLLLYQSVGGTNNLLLTNSGWGGDPVIASTAAAVGAFSWGSDATADSALLVTLPPGAYTAEVAGLSGDTGLALVEVYEVQ